eukprot:6461460-Amphidinium_carterae.1
MDGGRALRAPGASGPADASKERCGESSRYHFNLKNFSQEYNKTQSQLDNVRDLPWQMEDGSGHVLQNGKLRLDEQLEQAVPQRVHIEMQKNN